MKGGKYPCRRNPFLFNMSHLFMLFSNPHLHESLQVRLNPFPRDGVDHLYRRAVSVFDTRGRLQRTHRLVDLFDG